MAGLNSNQENIRKQIDLIDRFIIGELEFSIVVSNLSNLKSIKIEDVKLYRYLIQSWESLEVRYELMGDDVSIKNVVPELKNIRKVLLKLIKKETNSVNFLSFIHKHIVFSASQIH